MRSLHPGLRRVLILSSLTALTGCYVDPVNSPDEKTSHQGAADPNREARDLGTCRFNVGHGCFDGQIDAAKPFYVDGKQFFNAGDLVPRFSELLHLAKDGHELVANVDYKLVLLTDIGSDKSFYSGFSYDMTGPVPRSGDLHTSGLFSLDDLPEGSYELRVQKPVRFMVVPIAKTSANPAQPADAHQPQQPVEPPTTPTSSHGSDASTPPVGTGPAPTPVGTGPAPTPPSTGPVPTPPSTGPVVVTPTPPAGVASGHATSLFVDGDASTAAAPATGKTYCATLYSDQTITVRQGARLPVIFTEFRLHVTDSLCTTNGNQTTIDI